MDIQLNPWKRRLSGTVSDRAWRTRCPFLDVIDEQHGLAHKRGLVLFRRLMLGVTTQPDEIEMFWKLCHAVHRKPS